MARHKDAEMQKNTRKKVTDEQIKAAIEGMVAEREQPSIRKVRERLGGTGSMNRIQMILAAWRESQRPAEAEQAVLSESAQQALAKLLQSVRSEAVAATLDEVADLKTQLSELAIEGERLEDEIEQLKEINAQMEAQTSEAVTLAKEREQHSKQLENEIAQLRARVDEQVQALATAQASNQALQRDSAEYRQRLEQQTVALEDARQKTNAAQQSAAVADARLSAATQRIGQLEQESEDARQKTNAAQQSAAVADARLSAASQRIEQLEQELKVSQNSFNEAHTQHTKLIALHEDQFNAEHRKNAELMCRIDELEDKLLALKAKSRRST
jgi:colicin import membrane protein